MVENIRVIKTCIIDTMVDINHRCFSSTGKNNYINIIQKDEKIKPSGHGTAVTSIIYNNTNNNQITIFPVFSSSKGTMEVEELVELLNDIYANYNFDVINLSNGTVCYDTIDELEEVCQKIIDKGTIIVSAFDNNGLMSYPASFRNVIGVDVSYEFLNINEFKYVPNSKVNIVGTNQPIRVPWENNMYILIGGSSFVAAYITSVICQGLSESKTNFDVILEQKAKKLEYIAETDYEHLAFDIRKAIIFPVNKEMHPLIRFIQDLKFEIVGYYDVKYSMNIGKKISQVVVGSDNDNIINSINTINWAELNSFDTVIIGHLDRLYNLGDKGSLDIFLKKCVEFEKKVYLYDKDVYNRFLSCFSDKKKIFISQVTQDNISKDNNKLWAINTPVINIMGTSSKQGKYTVELSLRKIMEENNYTVGLISSEPNGWLLNADAVFPFGYRGTVSIDETESVKFLNEVIHQIEIEKQPDIILTASQSGTIPYSNMIFSNINISQVSFLYGTNPDAVILCVSPHDDFDYIKRTIAFIEAAGDTKVIAVAVFPVIQEPFCGGMFRSKDISKSEQLSILISALKEELKHITIVEQSMVGLREIADTVINYLS